MIEKFVVRCYVSLRGAKQVTRYGKWESWESEEGEWNVC